MPHRFPNLPDNDPIFAHAERNEILRQIRMFYDQMEVLEGKRTAEKHGEDSERHPLFHDGFLL